MVAFVKVHHYSKVMPKQTKACFGGFRDGVLVAAISFGWGSRPRHTIQKLFPSMNVDDYVEIGKMCIRDGQPKGSATPFMSDAFWKLHKRFPGLKLIFTWADGMWGKHGGVYQAANFLYGGFIWTDVYQPDDGKRIHPLQLQAKTSKSGMSTKRRTNRPSQREMTERGWKQYFGKQFRYVKFLCDRKEQQRLLAESPFPWTATRAGYPKKADLAWKQSVDGKRVPCEQPQFTGAWDSRERPVTGEPAVPKSDRERAA
jgi:hypothetical protein